MQNAPQRARPPRNQFPRLDPRRLPAAPGDTSRRTLEHALAITLVQRLGDRFCMTDGPGRCAQRMGVELRVSDLYARSPDSVRVVVGCRLVWPGNSTTDNMAQVFLMVRDSKGWRIADRGGVETPR